MPDPLLLDDTLNHVSAAEPPPLDEARPSPAELVAKAIAPVKRDFLRAPPVRTCDGNNSSKADERAAAQKDDASAPILKEKKSKRQLKRERRQEQKSALHICPEVAKSGKVSSCPYGDNCRFSHDLEAFKAQKPDDLDGMCPFLSTKGPCPYGLACRFAGTHKDDDGEAANETINGDKRSSEMNGQGKKKKMVENENENENDGQIVKNDSGDIDGNSCCRATGDSSNGVDCAAEVLEEDKPDEADATDELRPPKKTKCSTDDTCSVLVNDGNLPFRQVCKVLGADVTCGEMAMCTNLLQGQASEWALLRRHSSEDLFGVQICGAYPDTVARTVELIEQNCTVDFIDINMGCPIDIVVNKGAGSALLTKPMRMKSVVEAFSRAVDIPVTIKVRTGYFEGKNRIDSLIADIGNWGATAVTIHGRTRQQRYSKLADWEYIYQCARAAPSSLQVLGNGDVFSYSDWNSHKADCPELSTCMIARGALIKPWIFTEIKEQRHWDISSGERLDILKDYVRFGLQHWGSDSKGVETTRHFLLEWLSYTCRYVPVGLLDVIPQRMNWRPPSYFGRDDLETLMASDSAADWIRISEMLLGKVPSGFTFAPKHKSNAYDRAENG
ncbi:UNVERIFIED_CONTAM: tRNA-dihydrouridine(47) synthase [NAD(P)(+)]-like [Sesamum radiatum]|uniref:tRNA-dihydrouridine(47) synthase [NAD(P)(+)] n=1 Tax=Sesamum radiatum TaxID=300843 RepID=A0AAW2MVP6_SESRA